jgi:hypothetical protein
MQSSIHGRWLPDRPVKPGDDSLEVAEPPLPELVTFGYPVPQTIQPYSNRIPTEIGPTPAPQRGTLQWTISIVSH